ncbi:hypothetical protein ACFWJM_10715 [Streptomyces sp. NPDC127077]|uniref:hypothetical protein n=1 Tax=Streptomyces sp. NPDC127077 TaxID=3347131 RepID=UPI00365BDD9C
MSHLLVRLSTPQKATLRRYGKEGRNRKSDIAAAVQGAILYAPSYHMIPASKALASALLYHEQIGHPFKKAREWVTKVNDFANQHSPELQSLTQIEFPPPQDIMDTLEDDGPEAEEYVNAFHRAVADRVNAIDFLFNHGNPGPGPGGGVPQDRGPTPTRPLIGPDGDSGRVEDVVKVIESPHEEPAPGVPGKTGIEQPATTVTHASIEITGEQRQVASVLNVFIASPGDLSEERKIVKEVIQEWNRQQQHTSQKVLLISQMWEEDAVPILGEGLDGQAVINEQLLDNANIVFALFYGRLGSATPRHISGAAEEIERSINRGIPVHVYRSKRDPSAGHDPQQYAELQEYLSDLEKRGLIGSFRSHRELRKKVMRALVRDVQLLLGR